MKNWSVKILALATFALVPSLGFAQTTLTQPDIVGLKLGMTMSEAESALKKYNRDIKILPLNFLASTSEDISNFPSPRADKELQNGSLEGLSTSPKIKVPIELLASDITHFCSNSFNYSPAEISGNNSQPVYQVSGEWFILDFTPTDDGGRLYAISHAVGYPQGASFSPQTLQAQLIGKYGQPSETDPVDGTTDVWMSDRRGRLLPATHPDYERCLLIPIIPTAYGEYGDGNIVGLPGVYGGVTGIGRSFSLSTSGQDINSTATIEQYNEAFSGGSGDGLSRDDYHGVEAALDSIEDFAPNFLKPISDAQGNPKLPPARGCGVQIYAQFQPDISNGKQASLLISLSDQNAAFYDNGIAEYVTKKLSALAPAASAPAPNL